jgi:hypothetical protein
MAINDQGIMALPTEQAAVPEISLQDSYGAMREALQEARPDADMELQEALAEIKSELKDVTDQQLEDLIAAIQSLYDNPETYAQEVAQLAADGEIEAGDLPEAYDEEFLAAVLMVLIDEQRSRQSAGMPPEMATMMPPQQFARGGIAEAARMLASKGRRGDTMLAHITPREARLLKARGGSGTINPQTGLPEFFLKKIFKAVQNTFKRVVNAVKTVLKSPVGRVLGTIALGMVLGPAVMTMFPSMAAVGGGLTAMGSAVTGALASGTVAALSGGDLKSVLTSAAVGFLGAPGGPVGNFVGKYTAQVGVTNAAANAALTGAIVGTGAGLVSGQNLKESLKSGLTEGVISGGMAYFSGAPKVDVDNAAATAARDAVDTQTYVDEFGGLTKPGNKGTAGQAAKYQNMDDAIMGQTLERGKQYVAPDGNITTFVGMDKATGENIFEGGVGGQYKRNAIDIVSERPPAQAPVAAGPSTYKGTEIPTDIFAPKTKAETYFSGAPNLPALSGRGVPQVTPDTYFPGPVQPPNLSGRGAPQVTPDSYFSGQVQPPNLSGTVEGGDFVSSPAVSSAPSPYRVPEVGASLKKAITPGTMMEGLGELFMPGPSSAQYKEMIDDVLAKNPRFTPDQAADYLNKTGAVPGMLRTYGPGVAAGIGALGLFGGFTPKTPPQSEFAGQMRQPIDLSGDPSKYYIQGLPGVQYGPRGEIIGSSPMGLPDVSQNVLVAGRSYLPPMNNPMMYRSPMFMNQGGSIGSLPPRGSAGIASLAGGGYPRRIGQIEGPGTETSDDIPAMLSDGEFVMTARAVRGMGNGSRRKGAKKMYALMHQLERNAARG